MVQTIQRHASNKALKQMLILGTVDDMFIRSLHTKFIGYLNVPTRQILDNLYAQYARILSSNLKDNNVALPEDTE